MNTYVAHMQHMSWVYQLKIWLCVQVGFTACFCCYKLARNYMKFD